MAKAVPLVVDLSKWVEETCALPQNQDKSEVRTLATLVTAGFLVSMAEPLFYLFLVPGSLVARVAGMAPTLHAGAVAIAPGGESLLSSWLASLPSVNLVAVGFLICLLGTLPHLGALIFRPKTLYVTWPRRLAAKCAIGAAVLWIYLAGLATPLDVGAVEWAYGLRAFGSLLVGGAYGVSLNAQQLRERISAQTR